MAARKKTKKKSAKKTGARAKTTRSKPKKAARATSDDSDGSLRATAKAFAARLLR